MPPMKFPVKDTPQETQYFVEMLEPQSDAELGRKLQVGEIIRVPESKARRLVENLGIGRLVSDKDHQKWMEKRKAAIERRIAATNLPQYGRMVNANALNATQAELSRNPEGFDTSRLPRQDAAAIQQAEARGARLRQGAPISGDTLEQQLASLDQSEMEKGNISVSSGMRGDEFHDTHTGQVPQTGALGAPGSSAPTFEDMDEEDLEGDSPEDLPKSQQQGSSGRKGK